MVFENVIIARAVRMKAARIPPGFVGYVNMPRKCDMKPIGKRRKPLGEKVTNRKATSAKIDKE
jgi:hypothetical protein